MPGTTLNPAHTVRGGPSMRVQVTLWMVGISLVIFLALSVVFFYYQRSVIGRIFDTRLRTRSSLVVSELELLDRLPTDADLARICARALLFSDAEEACAVIFDQHHGVIARSRPVDIDLALLELPPLTHVPVTSRRSIPSMPSPSDADSLWRTLARRVDLPHSTGATLFIAASDLSYESNLRFTRQMYIFILPAAIIAAGVGAWIVSGLVLSPLRELHRIAHALSPEQLEAPVSAVRDPHPPAELAEFQRELEHVRARLRKALQAQDRFISNVSHELKTPVAILLAEAQTLPLQSLSDDSRRFVLSVIEEMRRLGRMVESFLTLTKLHGGKPPAGGPGCDFHDVVMESIGECSRMAAQHGVTIEPRLLDSEHSPSLTGDTELLKIMLGNLIRNAIRFSPRPGRVEISVAADEPGWITVSVRDYGPGIPPDLLDRVFDRFVTGPDHHQGRGHGLGLSIAAGIAEMHGGQIGVENHPGGPDSAGCRFTVRLPTARTPSAEPALNAGPNVESTRAVADTSPLQPDRA